MIGSVFGLSGSFAAGRNAAPGGAAARLLDPVGARLNTLAHGRSGLERIKAALTDLRDALVSARDGASPVPGRSALTPVVAQVEQTIDRPTFVTIEGETVQDGTVTVSLGKRPLVVGYERGPRAPLDARAALNELAAAVGSLASAAGAEAHGFVGEVSALLRSGDLATAVNRPDADAIGTALARIDAVLAGAAGAQAALTAHEARAAHVDLASLLLGAGADVFAGAGAADQSGRTFYTSISDSPAGSQLSSWA